ncbi:helix-turn-helix domain-containing protein [Streptomyces cacaoi]|uniref:helix-turn-helix domain-containing protein n=1 Tax=Streptomyces cacaoi TaxID=1898 RepID=UPI00262BE7A4|nr:helix-turn-helix transcriptional regulator [Streptomyces cacaoi]
MTQWSDYSTGERIKILRGREIKQQDLAEMTGLSVVTIQKAEQDRALSLPTLLKLAQALSVDTSIILGQQAPRRSFGPDDRVTLRQISTAVHDISAGYLPDTVEPIPLDELANTTQIAWTLYWSGKYQELGAILSPLVQDAAVTVAAAEGDQKRDALGLLSDAYQIAACAANLLGARDLAYAAAGHARITAQQAEHPLRVARVDSARSWIYLRDGRLADSVALATRAAAAIEPSYSASSAERLTVYGNLLTHCAVTSARREDEDNAANFLSQVHAVGARLGAEYDFHGARFGPTTATTQAVGVNVSTGRTGKALKLIEAVSPDSLGGLAAAARNRYKLDVAMAQADARMWDASLDTLEDAITSAPEWARHQALPRVIVERVGHASTSRLRRVSALLGAGPGGRGRGMFPPATRATAL